MPGLKRSLAYRMTLAVMVFSVVLTALSALGLFALQSREMEAAIERDLEHLGRVDVPSISASLWVMDMQQLQTHLDALCNIPHVARVQIEVKGKIVAASGAARPGPVIDRVFPLSYVLGAKTMDLGTLQVQASLAGISSELFSRTVLRLLFQAGQIFLVAMFMLALLRLILARRLTALEHHLGGLDPDRLDAPLVLPGPRYFKGEDELDLVARAVNAMSANLKEAFSELAAQKERLAVTLRSIGDGVITTDTRGRVTLMNEVAEKLTGWTQDTAVGKPLAAVFAIIDEVTRERRDNPVDRVLQTGGVVEPANHAVLARRDGSEIFVADSAAPIREHGGEIIGVVLVFRDITERKRAEAHRELLTVAIEQAAETVVITDVHGTIQYVNPIFETVTGYSPAEAIGCNPSILKSGEQDGAFYRKLWETIASGQVWEGRLVNRRKDGSLYTEDATISPVRDDAGRIINYVAVKRDVTEHLRHSAEKVMLEDQLRQSQKVEAIGRLAGGVAHDFNNLTAIVLGYGEMLLGRLAPEDPARKWVEQIVAAGRRSAALTGQLLAFSRRQTLQPRVLDLNDLLLNLRQMLGRLIGEDIKLELALAAVPGRVTADPGQIEQAITNLAINARDAMPRGGRLTVETTDVELDETYVLGHESVIPGKYVLLAVTDTGCGMDKATMALLFEPFFTTKEQGKGTGLGLATVYGIVKQSGGYVYAYSEPGKGTSFKIYLPRTEAEPQGKMIEAGGETRRGSGELILLVEDEVPLRELCEAVLTRLGYRVCVAASGPEALLLMEERRLEPDLVLTDVIMPGMSGAEMAARLRSSRPDLRVLYMSGYPDDAIARHGVLDVGMHFIQKPFSERALAAKVREALGEKEGAAPQARRVLMIDDDEQFRDLMRHFCTKRGHLFAGVDSSAAALAALATQTFDVLLVDLNIPGTSGERVLREIRATGSTVPAIVLTGDVAAADMEMLRPLGAVLALEKSSNGKPLLQAIEAAQRVV